MEGGDEQNILTAHYCSLIFTSSFLSNEKKNSNDFSQATPFLSSACIWNIIGPLPALSLSLYPPSCCFSFSLFLSLFMKWFLQLADLSSQFSARHFSSDSLHVFLFSLHPLIFLPSSFSLNFSNTLFLCFSLTLTHTLHLLFFDLLAPSVLSLTALHRHLGWKEEIRVKNCMRLWGGGGETHPHIRKKKKVKIWVNMSKIINWHTVADNALEGSFHCCDLNMWRSG